MKNSKSQRCVYCGTDKQLTKDHIPPKTLFPKPRPSNLLTVPSCIACNNGASKDDEYFRLMVTMRHDIGDHPAASRLFPSILRSLDMPSKRGLQQFFLENTFEFEHVTKSGLYLGNAFGYNVDIARMDRVVGRVARGLYFHDYGRPLPKQFCVITYNLDALKTDAEVSTKVINLVDRVTQSQPRVFGDAVFAYWSQKVSGKTGACIWFIAFYGQLFYLCFAGPQSKKFSS